MEERKIRVLLSKLGLDGHDRGVVRSVVNIAMALRDAGMEVNCCGRHIFPDEVAQLAIEEDVDVIGTSSFADAHYMALVAQLMRSLRSKGSDIPVTVILSGFTEPGDIAQLKEMGVVQVFAIGSKLSAIVDYVQNVRLAH